MNSKPIFGTRPFGKRDARFLLVGYFDPNGIETVPQSIEAWQANSRHEIVLFNLWPGRENGLLLPATLDLHAFDGIIIHPTVSYSPISVERLDAALQRGLAAFDGVKILMKQDEQVLSGRLPELVRSKRFDIVMTCLSAAEQSKVYPQALTGQMTLMQTLTGYVAPTMRQGYPARNRDIAVSYRGSLQPLQFGQLGYEKRGIGYAMSAILSGYPELKADISSRWEDRLSGKAWIDFLTRSNVVLGVESGANIFDFSGEVESLCKDYAQERPNEDPWSEAYYQRAHVAFLHRFEGNVHYAQISPRHFEAAAAGAAQLMYEGNYSGIFREGDHYFSLHRDLRNVDAALDFLRDEAAQRRMAERAFAEIILDRRYSYESFVEAADDTIDRCLESKGRKKPKRSMSSRPTAYVLAAHDPVRDPRIGWFASSLAATHDVTVIGMYPFGDTTTHATLEDGTGNVRTVRVQRTVHDAAWIPTARQLKTTPSEARGLLASLVGYCGAPAAVLSSHLGADISTESELKNFREHCEYMVNTSAALIAAVENLGAPDLIVAADLDTLFAGVACGEAYGSQVVHDAHEYWPFSYVGFQHWEIEFWQAIETRLMAHCSIRIAVTPQLAELMSREYNQPFLSLPNAASKADGLVDGLEEAFANRARLDPLKVLFLGNFALGRGFEEFIRAWQYVTSDAQLILRGPTNEYHASLVALARSLGLGEDRISFPEAVAESELIEASLQAHLGLISYNPIYFGYRYCCPNKLSQYLAAGLPILTSPTAFVSDFVRREDIGFVVDINDPKMLARRIDEIAAKRHDLVPLGRRARALFEERFNWDELIAPVLDRIGATRTISAHAPDLSWIKQKRPLKSFPRPAPPLSSILFGDQAHNHFHNLALASEGASVLASSPFHARPNDADAVLRSEHSYAAAIANTALPQWIEIDLGKERIAGALEVSFLDPQNFATSFWILARASTDEAWRILLECDDNNRSAILDQFPVGRLRYIRFEAFDFSGPHQRLLLRKLCIFESATNEPAGRVPVAGLTPTREQETKLRLYRMRNVATVEEGAKVVASSAFFAAPHDASAVLRADGQSYAAAIQGSHTPHWMEIDLGRSRTIEAVELEFLDAFNYSDFFWLLCRNSAEDDWRMLIDGSDNSSPLSQRRFEPGVARFIRLETFKFAGEQHRLLMRSLRVLETPKCEQDRIRNRGPAGHSLTPAQRERLGVHLMRDVAREELGVSIMGSSPFFDAPYDASAVLRREGEFYAAALEGAAVPHWIEIDLGQARSVSCMAIEWYDAKHYAENYILFGRATIDRPWKVLVEGKGGDIETKIHRFTSEPIRYVRLEAARFAGQNRFLIRALQLFT